MCALGHLPLKGKARGEASIYEKIAGMQAEINRDIDELVDLKKEIRAVIRQVSKPDYQTILELRYLCFWKWEKIERNMHYSHPGILKKHREALKDISDLLKQ